MINGVQDHRIITLRSRVNLTTDSILLSTITRKLIPAIRVIELMKSEVSLMVYYRLFFRCHHHRLCLLHLIILLLVLEVALLAILFVLFFLCVSWRTVLVSLAYNIALFVC